MPVPRQTITVLLVPVPIVRIIQTTLVETTIVASAVVLVDNRHLETTTAVLHCQIYALIVATPHQLETNDQETLGTTSARMSVLAMCALNGKLVVEK